MLVKPRNSWQRRSCLRRPCRVHHPLAGCAARSRPRGSPRNEPARVCGLYFSRCFQHKKTRALEAEKPRQHQGPRRPFRCPDTPDGSGWSHGLDVERPAFGPLQLGTHEEEQLLHGGTFPEFSQHLRARGGARKKERGSRDGRSQAEKRRETAGRRQSVKRGENAWRPNKDTPCDRFNHGSFSFSHTHMRQDAGVM